MVSILHCFVGFSWENLTVRIAGIHLKDMDLESAKDIKFVELRNELRPKYARSKDHEIFRVFIKITISMYDHLLDGPQMIETRVDEIYLTNNTVSSMTTIGVRADEIYMINNIVISETTIEKREDEIYLKNNNVIYETRSMRKRCRKRISTRAPF
ncbi:FAD-dependent pyridine nucleotide-disulfideoxidoreductase, partial [Striga asiatica]